MTAGIAVAASDNAVVQGLTHSFYRYPARFSPRLIGAIIDEFTEPGDLVADPFMGGGTTLVEAAAKGRLAVGVDINSLGVFVSRAKTTQLGNADLGALEAWADTVTELRLNQPGPVLQSGRTYFKHLDTSDTWRVRKAATLALGSATGLASLPARRFARCAVLKTAQWALDGRQQLPSVAAFREQLSANIRLMVRGAGDYADACAATSSGIPRSYRQRRALCVHRSAVGLDLDTAVQSRGTPRLIFTSPPYPGVHVLYHRWQIRGRRESALPYLIAGTPDGHGASFYGFAPRANLTGYFARMLEAFGSVGRLASQGTMLVQLVGFSDPKSQLPTYLDTLSAAGFDEDPMSRQWASADGRLWRDVPNRRWYIRTGQRESSGTELILFHRKR